MCKKGALMFREEANNKYASFIHFNIIIQCCYM